MAESIDTDYGARQRVVLHDLVMLSTQCTTKESHLERQHGSQKRRTQKAFTRLTSRIEKRYDKLNRLSREGHEDWSRHLQAKGDSQLKQLQAENDTVKKRLADKADSSQQTLKQSYEHAIWLAESIFEAAQNKYREDKIKAHDQSHDQSESLAEIEQQTQTLLRQYHQIALWLPQPPPNVRAAPPPRAELPKTDPQAAYEQHHTIALQELDRLKNMAVPGLLVGYRPYVATILLCLLATVAAQLLGPEKSAWQNIGIGVAAALVVSIIGVVTVMVLAKSQIRTVLGQIRYAISAASSTIERCRLNKLKQIKTRLEEAVQRHEHEVTIARERFEPLKQEIALRHQQLIKEAEDNCSKQRQAIEEHRESEQNGADDLAHRHQERIIEQRAHYLLLAKQRCEGHLGQIQSGYRSDHRELESRWREGLARIQALIDETVGIDRMRMNDWDGPSWNSWTPTDRFSRAVRFGQLKIDVKKLAAGTERSGQFQLALPEAFCVPALLDFSHCGSMLIHAGLEDRVTAIETLQMVMMRLLTTLPPGRARFLLIDPVGLGQSFAGFMHLADHDDAMVGARIWTNTEHIDRQLNDLTEHMENVIQKYLRNEYETIDQYNDQAGELAEPYRFLVVADFPSAFSPDALSRLSSIVSSGARCGVYTLVAHDARQQLPSETVLKDLEAYSINLAIQEGKAIWNDQVFEKFPLTLDPPPSEQFLTRILNQVGAHAVRTKAVQVPFDTITPPTDQRWTVSSTDRVSVPIGRTGATRFQQLSLGEGVAQHALIAGKTGSGKSSLLHVIITNLALWYHPDEVELYLVDFKKGVEFKMYATCQLPHARAVAIETDREFGISVLQRLDEELTRRGELYRDLGVQDLPAYRAAPNTPPMPRTLLIIDEFQEFFLEDDKLAQDAGLLLDRLVRQGRAFGMHVLLGSQTLGGSAALARSTIGQMAVRVALQCSEADSQLILSDTNLAARLLGRPGEAIYNDAGGLVEGNSPFQVAWLADHQREKLLGELTALSHKQRGRRRPPIIFEGNAPADLGQNQPLVTQLADPHWPTHPFECRAWIGQPVAIKDPTNVLLRNQSGANLLIVGQQEEPATAIMMAAMISLASHMGPEAAEFWLLDGTPADSPLSGELRRAAEILPHPVKNIQWRDVPEAMTALAAEWKRRQDSGAGQERNIFLLVHGLQRYRVLRRTEDDFGFSVSNDEKAESADKQFAEILREGPALGMHILTWSDMLNTAERTFDRQSLREFDHRVLLQMSAGDSSNLIDSPAANQLGFHRALYYSEENGVLEKFRPYALMSESLLKNITARFGAKSKERRAKSKE